MEKNIEIKGDTMCIAWFKKKIKKYNLVTKAIPTEGGTITGAGEYKKGTIVTVKTIPNSDYEDDRMIVKWSGLGMGIFYWVNNPSDAKFDGHVDTLLANGFAELRMSASFSTWDKDLTQLAAIIRAVAEGADIIWGVTSGGVTLTASNWSTYVAATLAAAQWAEDNGVFEFQIGNEEEAKNDDTTLTDAQLRTNLKALATEAKGVFTNGDVSYSFSGSSTNVDAWISVGKGDIDILGANIYMGGEGYYDETWKKSITNLVNAFGSDGIYLTEFAPSWSELDDYSTDEAVQAAAVTEMIDYIKASGMTRALFYCYINAAWLPGFGARKDDGTYRLLWNSLLNSN